ncbi:MAG TPA: hypothetical protein VN512_02245 [Clostridia bacterium]|nr:hypothetical protein [Clostridia bacterium]
MKEEQLYYKAMEANLAPPERIYRKIINERKTNPIPRRITLAAAACLAIFITAALCIPEARAAVEAWLKPAVDPKTYINTPIDERATAPAVSAAIEQVDETAVMVTVVDAADATWQAWAEKLSVELNELLYDGEILHITGTLKGNTGDLVKPVDEYTKTESEDGTSLFPPDNMVTCSARYSLNGSETNYTLYDALSSHDFAPSYVAERVAAGNVSLSIDLDVGAGLTGMQTIALDLVFTDMGTLRAVYTGGPDDTLPVQVALRISGLTFDATAGTAFSDALPVPAPASLFSDVKVLSYEENGGTATVGNDLLNLEGGTLSVLKIHQKFTGTAITMCLSLPESWTGRQCSMISDRISMEFIIDGQNQGGFGSAYMGIQYYDANTIAQLSLEAPPDMTDPHNIVVSVETGLMPEAWEHIKSFDIVLCVDELTEYNHTTLPTDDRVSVAVEKGGWSEDSETKRFTDCPLKVK